MTGDDANLGVPRHTTTYEKMLKKLREATPAEKAADLQLQTIDLWIGQLIQLKARIRAGRKI